MRKRPFITIIIVTANCPFFKLVFQQFYTEFFLALIVTAGFQNNSRLQVGEGSGIQNKKALVGGLMGGLRIFSAIC